MNILVQQPSYKYIAEEFLKIYYNLYDSDFRQLHNLYHSSPYITYAEEEFTNFPDLYRRIISHYKINKFSHSSINFTCQPVNDRGIVINVLGRLSVNNNIAQTGSFSETIILVKNDQNRYHIHNSILKVS